MTQERKLIKPCAFVVAPDSSSVPSNIAAKMASFVSAVNLDIIRLNARIETYNHCTEHAEQISALQAINDERTKIINRYPDTMASSCPSFVVEIQHHLFSQIKDIAKHLDPPSTPDINTSQILSEMINNMEPKKIAQLVNIFVEASKISQPSKDQYIQSALNALYSPLDEEFAAFKSFLFTHEITFLGGNNSNNYLIRALETNESFILKIENRVGQPKETAEQLIKAGLDGTLMPAYADRQVTCTTASGQMITRNISITDFCQGGDLIHHAADQKTEHDKIKSSLMIYTQMAFFLTKVQTNHAIFTDMKNSNWLLSETGQLKVSDTKGFCPTQSDGIYKVNALENQWTVTMATPFMNPPEWTTEPREINAEQSHAYMLGKNIYQYLTGCSIIYLKETHELLYDFSHSVFSSTLQGQVLQDLITQLINPTAEDRPSLDDVFNQLTLLQVYDACIELSNQIKANDLSPDGIDTKEFLSTIQLEIDTAGDIESITAVRDKLNDFVSMKEDMKQNPTDAFKTQCMNAMLKMKQKMTTIKTVSLPANESDTNEQQSDDIERPHL